MLSKAMWSTKILKTQARTLVNYPKTNYHENHPILSRIPKKYDPYVRLGRYEKPIGYQLLFIPCTWGVALGLAPFSWTYFLGYSTLFFVGSVSMRAAGCIVNDLWDVNYDKKVERTRVRPLASGELTQKQAFAFLVPHLAAGLGVLAFLNWQSIALSFAITPVAALYPLAKRYTHYPQLVLGIAFNSGVLIGYAAVAGTLDLHTAGLAYAAGIAWTLIYDTIYAHQDKRDDVMIGVKSTALAWGDNTKKISYYLNLFSLACLSGAGYFGGLSIWYYPAICLSHAHLYSLIKNVDLNDNDSCRNTFSAAKYFGLLVTLSLVIGRSLEGDEDDLLDMFDEVGEDLVDDFGDFDVSTD